MARASGCARWARRTAALLVAMTVLTGSTCVRKDDVGTTRPGPRWPGTTGQVNRLVVWLRGTGSAGFALVVNTLQMDNRGGVQFVVEDGAFTFKLYRANDAGGPAVDQPLGDWHFDEAATRDAWAPGGWGRDATFAFLLRWQGAAPPPGTDLVLVSEFTPSAREGTAVHRLAFTVQPTSLP